MLEPHQRAALIPNESGMAWHKFLGGRFIGTSLGIVIQVIQQQSHEHAELRGLVEHTHGDSLPVVSEFTGALSIDTREITVHETQPERHYSGQFSENGRVLSLRQRGQSNVIPLVHDETLAQLV